MQSSSPPLMRSAEADTPAHSLANQEASVRRDLATLGLPWRGWTASRLDAGITDVVVVGAGQFGVAVGGALKLRGVDDILLIDRAPKGLEGPWVTYARMKTLRSPKTLPGISFGIPSLTFQSWYRAAHGDAAWETLYKVPNGIWQDYILWVRQMLDLPVRNDVEAVGLIPQEGFVTIALADGSTLKARHVVVATGRAATGGSTPVPGIDPDLGADLVAHTMDMIDFDRLKGKQVAVIGIGSSAWDNAATALEARAASVEMFARRSALPQLNKGKASTGIGYFEGWPDLGDAERWRLVCHLEECQVPPPHETVHRALANPGLSLRFGTPIRGAVRAGDRLRLLTGDGGEKEFDFLILGTGFRVDLSREPLLAPLVPHMALWADRYMPPPDLRRPHLGRYPYIGRHFELLAKPGTVPLAGLSRIHLFNMACWVSTGTLAADVPTLQAGPDRLAAGIASDLFVEDFDPIFDRLMAWDEEHELAGTPFYSPQHINARTRL